MIEEFGKTKDGEPVQRVKIKSASLTASILTFGAALNDLRLAGVDHPLTLGFTELAPYEGPLFHMGTLMGPVANRISNGTAPINGQQFEFEKNSDGLCLHSGSAGIQHKVWNIQEVSEDAVTLEVSLPNGEGGFPGNRTILASFRVKDQCLSMELSAKTDAPTLINLANHSYWNLGPNPTIKGHHLQVSGDRYLELNPEILVPTGDILDVEDTRFDFRERRELHAGAEGLLDLNFCVSEEREDLRKIAVLDGPTGISMEMFSTEPGLQIFDGHILGDEPAMLNRGTLSCAYAGLALEAQFWPDAPNHKGFPSIELQPAELWEQKTVWSFSIDRRNTTTN